VFAIDRFLAAHPEYASTRALDDLRAAEYGRLDAQGAVYLDYTGGGLHADSQIQEHAALLSGHVFGNPHSASPSSTAMTHAVERARAKGRASTPTRYAAAAVRRFFAHDRRHPALTLERPGEEPVTGLFLAIAGNTAPWTYFGSRPVVLTPTASFDRGLDLIALRKMRTVGTLWAAGGMLTSGGIRGRSSLVYEDLDEFTIVADRPGHLQVDGDYLGERERVRFVNVPHALRVIC